MFAVGEYVAPPLGQYARQMKVFSKFNEFSLAGNKGTWVRDGNTIISVDQQSASNRFGGIKVFQLDSQRRLQAVGRAESAQARQRQGLASGETMPKPSSWTAARGPHARARSN